MKAKLLGTVLTKAASAADWNLVKINHIDLLKLTNLNRKIVSLIDEKIHHETLRKSNIFDDVYPLYETMIKSRLLASNSILQVGAIHEG